MKYVAVLERKLDSSSIVYRTIVAELKNNIEKKAATIEKHSRVRGIYMLIYCLFIMWNDGFASFVSTQSFFLIVISLATIIMIAWKLWQKRVLYVVSIWTVLFFIYFLLFLIDYPYKFNEFFIHYSYFFEPFCAFMILLPLVSQVFINWLYSENYYYVIINKIGAEFNLFDQAINSKDADSLPAEYNTPVIKAYFDKQSNPSSDTKVSHFTNTLNDRLNKIIAHQSFNELLIYAIKHLRENKIDVDFSSNKNDIKGEEIPRIENNYELRVKEYESITNKPKIRDYCKKHNLDYTKFQQIRKNKLK